MKTIEAGDICENEPCDHPATGLWVGDNGTLTISRDYLQAFKLRDDDAMIQGWEKSRWLKAADARDRAAAALARAEKEAT